MRATPGRLPLGESIAHPLTAARRGDTDVRLASSYVVMAGIGVRDASRMLAVSERTCRRWMGSGHLEPHASGVAARSVLELALRRASSPIRDLASLRRAWATLSEASITCVHGVGALGVVDDLHQVFAHTVFVDARRCRSEWEITLAVASALHSAVDSDVAWSTDDAISRRRPTLLLFDARGAHVESLVRRLSAWRSTGARFLLVVDDVSACSIGTPVHVDGKPTPRIPESETVRDLFDALSLFDGGATASDLAEVMGVDAAEVALRLAERSARGAIRTSRGSDGEILHSLVLLDDRVGGARFANAHALLRARWLEHASPAHVLHRWPEVRKVLRRIQDSSLLVALAERCAWAAERSLPIEVVDELLVEALERTRDDPSDTVQLGRVHLACDRASLFVLRGEVEDASLRVEAALRAAERCGDSRGWVAARLRVAELDLRRHRVAFETRQALVVATSEAVRVRDRIVAWLLLGNAAIGPGRLDEAERAYSKALSMAQRAAAERERLVALGNLALVSMLDGRPERAAALLRAVVERHVARSNWHSAIRAGLNLVIANADLGMHSEVDREMRELLRWTAHARDRVLLPAMLLTLAFSRLDRARYEAARRTFEAAIRLAVVGGFDEGCARMGLAFSWPSNPSRAASEMRTARECLERVGHRYADVAAAWEAAWSGLPLPELRRASPRDWLAITLAGELAGSAHDPKSVERALTTPSVLVRCAAHTVVRRRHGSFWIAADASMLVVDGSRVVLGRKRMLRRLLSELVAAGDAGRTLGEFHAAGWPEDRVGLVRARPRIHAALAALRELGLRGRLHLGRDGRYRLRTGGADAQVTERG
jgi:tetratricopeptide (TPR) repeat protein